MQIPSLGMLGDSVSCLATGTVAAKLRLTERRVEAAVRNFIVAREVVAVEDEKARERRSRMFEMSLVASAFIEAQTL